jgi:hypothetical protein
MFPETFVVGLIMHRQQHTTMRVRKLTILWFIQYPNRSAIWNKAAYHAVFSILRLGYT